MKHTPEEIKYRLSDLGVQIGNIAIEYIAKLEKENAENESEARELNIRLDRLIKENAELQHKVDTLQGFLDRDVEFDNLQKENAELKGLKDVATLIRANNDTVTTLMQLNNMLVSKSQHLTKAREIMNIAIEGIKHWGIVGGTERPFEKQAEKLFNLFLDKAEQFLKDSKQEG